MKTNSVSVVLVEDDRVDQMAVQRAFKDAKIANPIIVANDGIEAMELLMGKGDKPPLPRPYLILLDINLPRMNGLEFLKALRAEPTLQQTVVFMLTTSDQEKDQKSAYELNVAGYVLKSNVGEGFMKLINLLEFYWNLVELPKSRH